MARSKMSRGAGGGTVAEGRRLSNAERASFYARREAAKVLRKVLQGDARRRAVGSVKTLVYSPEIRNKKATFALVCQTLKHLAIIKDVIDGAGVLNSKWKLPQELNSYGKFYFPGIQFLCQLPRKWVKDVQLSGWEIKLLWRSKLKTKRQKELVYVITYDILFGKEIPSYGTAEKYLSLRRAALRSALARLLVKLKVKRLEDLLSLDRNPDVSKPRYVRVNTLKLDVESASDELSKHYTVRKDNLVPDLLILPVGTDLHDHPLVRNGSVFLQGKASSMVAAALGPEPGWEVLDACSAPGNKTVHLAALMRGKGRIIACELNKDRVRRLRNTIELAGATNVEVVHGDFLDIDPKDPTYSEVRAILLDPSCSGSGTAMERLDHLLPSRIEGEADDIEMSRLRKLAAFQKKALEHALSFPSVERIVYSTCSIHQVENEDVVASVLALASSHGFQLATPFPEWPRRGFPVFDGSGKALRMDPSEDKEGFFIALFVRNLKDYPHKSTRKSKKKRVERSPLFLFSLKLSKAWVHSHMSF